MGESAFVARAETAVQTFPGLRRKAGDPQTRPFHCQYVAAVLGWAMQQTLAEHRWLGIECSADGYIRRGRHGLASCGCAFGCLPC